MPTSPQDPYLTPGFTVQQAYTPGTGTFFQPDGSVDLADLSPNALSGLNGTYAQRPGPASIMAIGDSITRNGNTDPTGAADYLIGPQSYLFWASLLSGGRLQYKGVAATGGLRTDQIITNHLPAIVAARPAYCVVHAGTNDNGTLTQAQTFANLTTIFETLLTAGITPIATTFLPKQTLLTTSAAVQQQLSVWVTRYAQRRVFPCVDWNSLFVDPTTGGWTGYNAAGGTYQTDTTHPNGAGAKAMGQALWIAISGSVPNMPLYVPTANNCNFGALTPSQTNALLLTDTNADGVADGFNKSGTATFSLAAMSGAEGLGNWQTITSAGSGGSITANNTALVAGHTYLFTCKVKTSGVKTAGVLWDVRFTDGNTADVFALRNMGEDVTLGTIYHEWVMPSGTSGSGRLIFDVTGGTGPAISLGQIGIHDLTAVGIA